MQKLVLGLVLILLILLLTITKSVYIEWEELFIIIGALTLASVIYLKHKSSTAKHLAILAVSGFVFCWGFGIVDIIIDHYLYYLPNGSEDGSPLTIKFKVEEFSDDLFIGSIISMFVVVALTISSIKLFKLGSEKTR